MYGALARPTPPPTCENSEASENSDFPSIPSDGKVTVVGRGCVGICTVLVLATADCKEKELSAEQRPWFQRQLLGQLHGTAEVRRELCHIRPGPGARCSSAAHDLHA